MGIVAQSLFVYGLLALTPVIIIYGIIKVLFEEIL